MKNKIEITWSENAKNRLDNIYDYISQDSKTQAAKVVSKIINSTKNLIVFPEGFPKEPLLENLGNYRFYPVYRYKIIYRIVENQITITDIFHTSQNPEKLPEIDEVV